MYTAELAAKLARRTDTLMENDHEHDLQCASRGATDSPGADQATPVDEQTKYPCHISAHYPLLAQSGHELVHCTSAA
ncbi:MAG: hypothetical protein WCC54_28685, partial [Pseudolabrys sp.]